MVDVGAKARTRRIAVAEGTVRLRPATLARILAGRIEKGDVLAAARLAGVMAVKRTPDLIPLCHPIAITAATVEIEPAGAAALRIRARVETRDRTGVEMEALTAVAAAGLTVYDMCKAIDPAMAIEDVALLAKSGGKSGAWKRPA
jgi:cyclic pyranopterin phosphate synthase